MIQTITILVCAILMAWGGYNWHNARRFIMPPCLALACFLITHSWWSASVLVMIPLLCMGDGPSSPLCHIFNQGWGKAVWGLLVALGASLGLFYAHFMPLPWFLAYLTGGFLIYNLVKNLNQIIGDLIFGGFLGCLVLIIHS